MKSNCKTLSTRFVALSILLTFSLIAFAKPEKTQKEGHKTADKQSCAGSAINMHKALGGMDMLPASFIENQNQISDPSVRYVLKSTNTTRYLKDCGTFWANYVPNEIIVKFKQDVADKLSTNLSKKSDPKQAKITPSLEKLNQKYKVREIRQVVKNFNANINKIDKIKKANPASITAGEKRILSRLKHISPPKAQKYALDRIYTLKVDLEPGQKIEDAIKEYNSDPDVEYAERNYILRTLVSPNDTLFANMWQLHNTGQSGGTEDADIDAPEAWDIETGSSDIIVAVIDTGVDYTHRDIDGNMWINQSEQIGETGVDDDENGFIDDVYGYNFSNSDSDPSDDQGHGTHCAGTIAAEGNNSTDIMGITWQAKVMALKFLNAQGFGSTDAAIEAISYAVDNGARVLSNSWGGGEFSQALQDAIDSACESGVVFVAAAGNESTDTFSYPAAHNHVIAVAATNSSDEKASFSNYGLWVDIAAPGEDILSLRATGTAMGSVYDDYTTVASGTSMACPHVAGACALLLSHDAALPVSLVEEILQVSGDPIEPGICNSNARLNIYGALRIVDGKGYINLDQSAYSCDDTITVKLIDLDLRGQGSQTARIESDTEDWEILVLNETDVEGVFACSISTSGNSADPNDGILQVVHDGTITVIYDDLDDGTGYPAQATDMAIADCVSPIVTNLQVDSSISIPVITVQTDELTTVRLLYGNACNNLTMEQNDSLLSTSHMFRIKGLMSDTQYFYIVEATDFVDNETISDNNGQCHSFMTIADLITISVPGDFETVQQAIDHSWNGNIIWLADGVYSGEGNYDITFDGRLIALRSENGPENCVIDCQKQGRGFIFNNKENDSAILDGITIKNGYATTKEASIVGDFISCLGGGMLCYYSTPTIINCRLLNNEAYFWGGGIYYLGDPNQEMMLENCTLMYNNAIWGGGITHNGGTLLIKDCGILMNEALAGGGGIDSSLSFVDPNALEPATLSIENSYIAWNKCYSGAGGGIFSQLRDVMLIGIYLESNSADYGGGYCSALDQVDIDNSVFVGNTAYYGGGLCCYFFEGWEVEEKLYLTNSTFIGNDNSGLARFYNPNSNNEEYVTNCIFWNNKENQVELINSEYSNISFAYNDIQDGQEGIDDIDGYAVWRDGNINTEPAFALSGDFHLLSSSDCADAGTNDPNGGLAATDADGNPRVFNNQADMGAFEYNSQLSSIAVSRKLFEFTSFQDASNPEDQILAIRNTGGGTLTWEVSEECLWLTVNSTEGSSDGEIDEITFHVDTSGLGAGKYLCEVLIENNAANSPLKIFVKLRVGGTLYVPSQYANIQMAMDAAADGDTVLIADGTYTGNGNRDLDPKGKSLIIKSENGPQTCIIDCQGTDQDPHRGFSTFMAKTDADLELSKAMQIVIEGITIKNGYVNADYFSSILPYCGGAILSDGNQAVTVKNCVADSCYAPFGGGFYIVGTLWNKISVENCEIINNTCAYYGGGLFLVGDLVVRNSIIKNNSAGETGGGMVYNSAPNSVNAICNLTVMDNHADTKGGGIFIYGDGVVTVANCIVRDNNSLSGSQIYLENLASKLVVSYSNIQNDQNDIDIVSGSILDFQANNIDTDSGLTEDGCHLATGSACINAGSINILPVVEVPELSDQYNKIVHWKLDETMGTVASDDSGNGNAGTINGNPVWQPEDGHYDGCIRLDGDGDFIAANSIPFSLTGKDVTIVFWVRGNRLEQEEIVLAFNTSSGGDKLMLGHPQSSSNLYVYQYGNATNTGISVFDDLWHLLVLRFIWQGGFCWWSVSVDAQSFTQHVVMSTSIAGNDLFSVGQGYNGVTASDFFKGDIDDFRIYGVYMNSWYLPFLYKGNEPLAPALYDQVDIDGEPRIMGGHVDMGADEFLPVHNITQNTGYATIQAAIDDANDYNEIIVYPGTYNESIDFMGKAITLKSTDPNDWSVIANTIIDAYDLGTTVVKFISGEDSNSVLKGLTLKNGTYGIYTTLSSSPTITRCIVSNNSSTGIWCMSGSPIISNCIISENSSYGIFYGTVCAPTIVNNLIYENLTGIYLVNVNGPVATIRNNTIADNANYGIRAMGTPNVAISNCIIWNNSDDLLNCSATYSCIEDGDTGTGNISSNPNFIVDDPFHRLQSDSPCIDAGDPNGVYTGQVDIEGDVRVIDITGKGDGVNDVDMGSDEYKPD